MGKVVKFMPKKNDLKTKILKFINKKRQTKRETFIKKCMFLYDQAFRFYCDYHKARIGDRVDFHYELYAKDSATKQIIRIILEKRVNESVKSRVVELKKLGRTEELKLLGVC